MIFQSSKISRFLTVALCAGALSLTACNDKSESVVPVASTPATAVSAVAPSAVAYTPPTAAHLYEMVAPIAIYPDKLVAQVLAGSTYPQQITQADGWLANNSKLTAGQLTDAAEVQTWDPSVKALTAFKRVLDQMANNLAWTTALGQAYYNDPSDVLNAIQVMRQRAAHAGQLKSNPQFRVAVSAAPVSTASTVYGEPVVALAQQLQEPQQLIRIEPAQADVVYVPSYNPQQIYGEPIAVYPGYVYSPSPHAPPGYSTTQIATAGALTFGMGVVVGAALEHHDWGWHAWDLNWGRPENRRPDENRPRDLVNRPAVTYNHTTYVSRSETVINNSVRNTYINTNNTSNNTNNTTNTINNGVAPQQAQAQPAAQAPQRPQPQPAAQITQVQQPTHPLAQMPTHDARQPIQPLPTQNARQQQQAEQLAQQNQAHQLELQHQQAQQIAQHNLMQTQQKQQLMQMQALQQQQAQARQQQAQQLAQQEQHQAQHAHEQAQLQAQQKQTAHDQLLVQQQTQQAQQLAQQKQQSQHAQEQSQLQARQQQQAQQLELQKQQAQHHEQEAQMQAQAEQKQQQAKSEAQHKVPSPREDVHEKGNERGHDRRDPKLEQARP